MPRAGDSSSERVPLASFAGCCLLAGGNAVGIRFSNRELDPLWGAALRFGAAALILLAVMAVFRLELPRGRALAGAMLFGVLNFGVTFGLAYYAFVRIHAGLGQTVLALVPLAALLLAVMQRQERFRVAAAVGTVFAGSLLAGDEWVLPERAATWWALGYLVVAGSVLNFVLYLLVIRHWGASRAAYVFVVIPVVAIMLSAWLDDEPLTAGLLLGAPLILAGVYLGALRPARGAAD